MLFTVDVHVPSPVGAEHTAVSVVGERAWAVSVP